MTRFFYDTEFLDDGVTIEFISIGIVREDGETYYAVNRDADWERIRRDRWLMKNVVPHLPPEEEWKNRRQIRDEAKNFLLSGKTEPSLWAWFASYDHVVLSQLWGKMLDIPRGIPMFTNDLRSLVEWERVSGLPKQGNKGRHDALADALHLKVMFDYMIEFIQKRETQK